MMFMLTRHYRQYVTAANAALDEKDATIKRLRRVLDGQRDSVGLNATNARKLGAALNEALAERDAARATLAEIAAMETPSCASIGRRMARVARGGAAADVEAGQ